MAQTPTVTAALPPPAPEPSRVRAIKAELEKCAREYQIAKEALDKAQIEYEAVREKFSYVRGRASELLEPNEWYEWRTIHSHVLFAGMPIGEAIDECLWSYAWDTAFGIVHGNKKGPFDPSRSLQEIYKELDRGGFEFRSSSPLREINAALMQLKEAVKIQEGRYQRIDAQEQFDEMRKWKQQQVETK